MEETLEWLAKEIVQHLLLHYLEIAVWGTLAGGGYVLGALVFGRRYKQRIAALEEAARERDSGQTVINLAPGAVYNETHEGGITHVHLHGAGEIVSPHPVRIIEASLEERIGISDNFELEWNPGDKKGDLPK